MAKQKLGQILIEMGYVTQAEVDSALETQQSDRSQEGRCEMATNGRHGFPSLARYS